MISAREQETGRGLLRRGLAGTALAWAIVGLLLGLAIVLPTPDLGLIWPNLVIDLLAMFVEEQSLLLAVFALLGIALAALARRVGARRSSRVAVWLGVVTVGLSVVPVVQGWRLASQEAVPLSLSEYFSLPVAEGPAQTVAYARPEGQVLKLDVWRPRGVGAATAPARRPAVVAVHGGGGLFGSRGEEAFWAGWLAENGYVAFSIDYRLGPRRSLDATGDVKCAVGWVKENAHRYDVDPDRIALMGRSAGGLLVLLAAYTEADPRVPPSCDVPDTGVAAVAAFYAPSDLARLDEGSWSWWRPGLASSASDSTGFTAETARELRLASPTYHLDPGDPPTYLAQGGRDQWTPPEQSELLARQLEDEGVPHRFVELPRARHAFDAAWGGWNQQIVRYELDDFLVGSLGGPDGP